MKFYSVTRGCPKCGKDVEFEAMSDPFPCPHCGVSLAPGHDCNYDEIDEDMWCNDWLELEES